MTYSKDNLRQIFQQPFNQEGWQNMLLHYFHASELKAERERIDVTPDNEKGYYLGAIDTTDNYRIGLFYYQIQHGNVARKRVGLRNLVKSFINPNWGEFDAALVVFDSGSVWRLSFVCDIKGENTAAKRFTYVFGESDNYYNTPVGRFDVLQRNGISFENIKDAFSVERLNKDFFNGYKERYVKFLKYINDDTKENRDYVKKLLGRLVFLQFLQKKGWMGVPANRQGWNGGDKFYLNHLIERYEGNDRLLSDVLEPLFFNTLNERRDNDLADSRLGENIKIPYLNGGLFDKDELDKKDIDFPYDYFKELMDFFAMYNFTIDENDPEDSEIGIDPEMLGHIFENLLEDNKDKGAFYTPKEIVQYMSKESVAQYLKSNTPEELHTAIDSLIKQRAVEPILQNKENARLVNKALAVVKVCDPAIGSGAFPMGVLNVLFDCRHLLYGFIGKNEDFSYAKVKREIIQNNIYGVDIEKGAVDIARLRFWLVLVVDENEPQPLPNLDYKIMCGDSLLHRFPLDAPFQNVLKDYNLKNDTHYTLDDYRQWVYDYTNISDHTQKDDFRKRIEDIKHAFKTELSDKEKSKIAKVRGTIENLKMEDLFGGKKKENEKKIKTLQKELKALEQQREEIESNKIYDQAFEWRFEFPALLDEDGNFMGFDIVIGNPPYLRVQGLREIYESKAKYYEKVYQSATGRFDFYVLFMESGYKLLAKKGILSYILPHKFINSDFGVGIRKFIYDKKALLYLIHFGSESIFEKAKVYTCIIGLSQGNAQFLFAPIKPKDIGSFDFKSIPISVLSNVSRWDFQQTGSSVIMDKMKRMPYRMKDVISICSQGTVSMGDDLYMLKGHFEGDYFIGFSEQTKKEVRLEKKILRPELKGEDVKRYEPLHNSYWLIYPHHQVNGKTVPYEEMEMQNLFPLTYEYLLPFKDELIEKKIRYKTNPKYWYALHRSRDIQMFDQPKIITAEISLGCNMSYDGGGLYHNTKCYTIIPNEANKGNTLAFLGLFNSKMMWYFLSETGYVLRGGFFCFKTKYLEPFPVPELLDKDVEEIGANVRAILAAKASDATADTSLFENRIDLLVYHLYGLTYDEVLIVDPETPITREEYEQI